MIDLGRRVGISARLYHEGKVPPELMGRQLRGSTLGVMGYGAIGRYLCDLGAALGMHVVVFDPFATVEKPVIRQVVDLGGLEAFPSNLIEGFAEALIALMPTLDDHACSLGRRGGFITRLREGTWLGHVSEHVALELQNLAGTLVRHGKTRGTGEYGKYNVIFEYREEQVGIEAGKKAVALVNHLVAPGDPEFAFDYQAELESLIRFAERLAFGPSTQALLDEAAVRDIPAMRLDKYSLVQLGQGVPQQRIRATMTSLTSGIAVDIASTHTYNTPKRTHNTTAI